jgi:5-methylthioadenosine/S-adenosylhomocysteine deaminase
MQSVDTLIEARWLIPVEPDGRVLSQHAVAVRDAQIVDVLPIDAARSKYRADDTVTLNDHAVIPGFVNAHTHAAMNLFRGLADDLPLMDWLQNHIWPAEAKWVSADFARDGTDHAIAEMLRGGTTCFNDMYFFSEATAASAERAGMRAVVGMIALDFPSAYAQSADEYLSKGIKLHDHLKDSPLLSTTFAPHAPYTVSDAPLERIRTYADELDRPIHMHVHETAFEVADAFSRTGKRPVERLKELGLLTPRMLAVHMTQLLDDEIALLAQLGVHVIHCPESNLKLASGFCPVHKLIQAGVNVALGTDGAASNNDLDMFGEMRTAALLAKGVAGDATALPAHTVLRMATLNGAKALGLDHRIGSIAAGKAADLAAIDLSSLSTQPVYDPVSQIVYSATRDQVSDVWVNGKRLLDKGQLRTFDEDELKRKASGWRDRIHAGRAPA